MILQHQSGPQPINQITITLRWPGCLSERESEEPQIA
jgi:hypothetical protein